MVDAGGVDGWVEICGGGGGTLGRTRPSSVSACAADGRDISCVAASISATSAAHDAGRASRGFSSMRATSASTAGGAPGATARNGGGSSRRCAAISSSPPCPNGGRPVIIS